MAGLGVFQMFSKPGTPAQGFIPLGGTNPDQPVFGPIYFDPNVKIGAEHADNYIIPITPGGDMKFLSDGTMDLSAGVDGFSQIWLHSFDNDSNIFVQSGTGGIFQTSINQIAGEVNDMFGLKSNFSFNPSHFNFQATALDAVVDISTDGTTLGFSTSDSTFSNAAINLSPGTIYENVDDAGGNTINLQMSAPGVAAFSASYASTLTGIFSISEDDFVMQSDDPFFGQGVMHLSSRDFTAQMGDTSLEVLTNSTPGNTNGVVIVKTKSLAGIARVNTFNDQGLNLDGGLRIFTVGSGVSIKAGANATAGAATLVAGTVTVANTKVTSSTIIILQRQFGLGTVGTVEVTGRVNGTSFTITSSNPLDASIIGWFFVVTI